MRQTKLKWRGLRVDLRHTYATLLLGTRAPITYVAGQLGHKDASITLRVRTGCLTIRARRRIRSRRCIKTQPRGTRRGRGARESSEIVKEKMVSRIFASWNQLNEWLRQIERLRRAG